MKKKWRGVGVRGRAGVQGEVGARGRGRKWRDGVGVRRKRGVESE